MFWLRTENNIKRNGSVNKHGPEKDKLLKEKARGKKRNMRTNIVPIRIWKFSNFNILNENNIKEMKRLMANLSECLSFYNFFFWEKESQIIVLKG